MTKEKIKTTNHRIFLGAAVRFLWGEECDVATIANLCNLDIKEVAEILGIATVTVTLSEAVERAAKKLPEAWSIYLCIENGSATVEIRKPNDVMMSVDPCDDALPGQILQAIKICKESQVSKTATKPSDCIMNIFDAFTEEDAKQQCLAVREAWVLGCEMDDQEKTNQPTKIINKEITPHAKAIAEAITIANPWGDKETVIKEGS